MSVRSATVRQPAPVRRVDEPARRERPRLLRRVAMKAARSHPSRRGSGRRARRRVSLAKDRGRDEIDAFDREVTSRTGIEPLVGGGARGRAVRPRRGGAAHAAYDVAERARLRPTSVTRPGGESPFQLVERTAGYGRGRGPRSSDCRHHRPASIGAERRARRNRRCRPVECLS